MQTRELKKPVFQCVLICCFAVSVFLPCAVKATTAGATMKIRLPKLARGISPVLIFVKAVEAETANLLSSTSLKSKSSKVTLITSAVPQIVFVEMLTSDGNTQKGNSVVLRPVDRKKLTVDPRVGPSTSLKASESVRLASGFVSSLGGTSWPPAGVDLIGVPRKGFTVDGLDLSSRDVSAMAVTDLTTASCYGKTGGFAVVETDPEILEIIRTEIELSNSQWADPSTRLTNRYVAPNQFVNGSWSSDGANLTVTYRLVDSKGQERMSKSGTGPLEQFSEISKKIAMALAEAMCQQQNILSLRGNWQAPQGSMSCRENGQIAFRIKDSGQIDCDGGGHCEGDTTFECEGYGDSCTIRASGTIRYELSGQKEGDILKLGIEIASAPDGQITVCCPKSGCQTSVFIWGFLLPYSFTIPYADGARTTVSTPLGDYDFTLLLKDGGF